MLFLMLHVRLVNAVADFVFTCQWHLPHAVLNISHDIHERPRLLLRSELCQTLPTSSSQTQAACFQHFPLTEPVMGLHPLVPLRSLVRSPKNMAGLWSRSRGDLKIGIEQKIESLQRHSVWADGFGLFNGFVFGLAGFTPCVFPHQD